MNYFDDYGHLFQKPWCPIFGISPGQGLPHYDPLAEASKIIDDAREILNVWNDPSESIESNYPALDNVFELLKKEISIALSKM